MVKVNYEFLCNQSRHWLGVLLYVAMQMFEYANCIIQILFYYGNFSVLQYPFNVYKLHLQAAVLEPAVHRHVLWLSTWMETGIWNPLEDDGFQFQEQGFGICQISPERDLQRWTCTARLLRKYQSTAWKANSLVTHHWWGPDCNCDPRNQ